MHVDRLIEDKLTIERLDQLIITITKHNWKKKSMGPTNLYALSHQGGSLHASSKNSDVLQKSWIRNTTAETNAKMLKKCVRKCSKKRRSRRGISHLVWFPRWIPATGCKNQLDLTASVLREKSARKSSSPKISRWTRWGCRELVAVEKLCGVNCLKTCIILPSC